MGRLRTAGLLIASAICGAAWLFADGGAVLLQKQAGPFVLTVFGSPSPLRVGSADLSVMVQRSADRTDVSDAKVALHLSKVDAGTVVGLTVPATHKRATNKLLYASSVNLPSAGHWQITVDVRTVSAGATAAGGIEISEAQAPLVTYWPYLAVVPLLALLFAINRWLRRRRDVRYRRARASLHSGR